MRDEAGNSGSTAAIGCAGARSTLTLDGGQARRLLESYGVCFAPWEIVADSEQAVAAAELMGYPVVLKSAAPDVAHKSDVGCVRTDIADLAALRTAYSQIVANARSADSATPSLVLVERMAKGAAEIAVGLNRSPTFGPTVLVGLGGIWVELMQDFALRICPVDAAEARKMIMELRSFPLLAGFRGRKPCDIDALAQVLVAVSRLGLEHDNVAELDLNPVMVMEDGRGAVAVDARVVLSAASPAGAGDGPQ